MRSARLLYDRDVLTQQEAHATDAFQNLELIGVKRAQFQKAVSTGRSPTDAIWWLWQKAIHARPELARGQYYAMALFLAQEGRDSRHVLGAHHEAQLRDYERMEFVRRVKVLGAGSDSCPACQEQSGSTFTVAEALERKPLPHPACTHPLKNSPHGFCRCTYGADFGVGPA